MQLQVGDIEITIDEGHLGEDDRAIRCQVDEYLNGERRTFELSIEYPTTFTGSVMRAMAAIPYGSTRTYGDLAREVDSHPIAVGQACGRNPIPIIVPCHRVIGKSGLGGFSAGGSRNLELKRALLHHERSNNSSARSVPFALETLPNSMSRSTSSGRRADGSP